MPSTDGASSITIISGAQAPPASLRHSAPIGPDTQPSSVPFRRRSVLQPLAVWLGSRVALIGLTLAGSALLGTPAVTQIHGKGGWVLERLVWWDSLHFLRIADRGYLPPGIRHSCCDQAFFPGYPLTIRLLTPLIGRPEWAAPLISLLFGAVAAVLLWRVAIDRAASAGDTDPRRAGLIAVSFLAVAPYGIFLSAAYSEALFLAFAIGAWWAGMRRRWWWAGLLLAGAAAVRINGALLAAALAVMYLVQLHEDRRRLPRPDILALAAPALVVGAFFGYLRYRTGSWTNWMDAEHLGWHRESAWPWQGIAISWDSLRAAGAPDLAVSRAADLLTVLAGLALVVVLLVLRRWPDATYLGLSVSVVAFSTVYVSSPRYALTWFPVFLLVTDLARNPRRRWLAPTLIIICLPLEVAAALAFSAHLWVA